MQPHAQRSSVMVIRRTRVYVIRIGYDTRMRYTTDGHDDLLEDLAPRFVRIGRDRVVALGSPAPRSHTRQCPAHGAYSDAVAECPRCHVEAVEERAVAASARIRAALGRHAGAGKAGGRAAARARKAALVRAARLLRLSAERADLADQLAKLDAAIARVESQKEASV